jgi:hypothetical protein
MHYQPNASPHLDQLNHQNWIPVSHEAMSPPPPHTPAYSAFAAINALSEPDKIQMPSHASATSELFLGDPRLRYCTDLDLISLVPQRPDSSAYDTDFSTMDDYVSSNLDTDYGLNDDKAWLEDHSVYDLAAPSIWTGEDSIYSASLLGSTYGISATTSPRSRHEHLDMSPSYHIGSTNQGAQPEIINDYTQSLISRVHEGCDDDVLWSPPPSDNGRPSPVAVSEPSEGLRDDDDEEDYSHGHREHLTSPGASRVSVDSGYATHPELEIGVDTTNTDKYINLLDYPDPCAAFDAIFGLPSPELPSSHVFMRTEDRRGVGYDGPPPASPPAWDWGDRDHHVCKGGHVSHIYLKDTTDASTKEDPAEDHIDLVPPIIHSHDTCTSADFRFFVTGPSGGTCTRRSRSSQSGLKPDIRPLRQAGIFAHARHHIGHVVHFRTRARARARA